jgi:tRNA threonylcarbamoyladenosine biosynthesis protein TsaB
VTGIDGVAVVDGPGSFTGVRVGLSAAKGICEAAGIGMVAISRLALVAAAAGQRGGTVAALLDGGRGEFYCGLYRGRECLGENLMGREGVLEIAASGAALVTCEARVAEALAGLSLSLVEEPGALPILAFATAKIAAGDWTDVVAADANYLRRTDAEVLFDRNRAG